MAERQFNEDDFPKDPAKYILLSELGHGATSSVYRASAQLRDGSTVQVAIKIMDLSNSEDLDLVFREITLMRAMKHENLASVITCFLSGDRLWIVMQLLGGGSVRAILKELAPEGFKNEQIIAALLHGALQGLAYMHASNYIHRDIKAGNILLSSSGVPRLADFGVAATTTTGVGGGNKKQAHTFTGTPCWMAPEVISQDEAGYTTSADIWSLGITALELAYGAPPYAKLLPLKAMMATIDSDPPTPETYMNPTRTKDISKEFRKFIARALKKEPSERPTALELLADPFLKKAPGPAYLVEHVINLLPPTHLGTNNPTLNVPPEIYGGKPPGQPTTNPLLQNNQDADGFIFDTLPIHKNNAQTIALQQQVQQNRPQPQPTLQQPQLSQPTQPQQQSQPAVAPVRWPQLTQQQFQQLTPEQQQQYIYQQQQAQLQFQQAQQQAQQQVQQQAQFQAQVDQTTLQNVAHAIREIQTRLLTLTEMVKTNQNPDELPALHQEMQVLSQQLATQQTTLQLHLQQLQVQQQQAAVAQMAQPQQQQQQQQYLQQQQQLVLQQQQQQQRTMQQPGQPQ